MLHLPLGSVVPAFVQTPVFARQTFLLLPHCQPLPPAAFASVADRYCYGSFPGRQEIALTDGEDALTQVCRWYLQHTECPRQSALHRVQYRNDHVAQLVHDFKADGAIYEQMKFCTYWSYERVIANQVMPRDYGIHILSIDRPYIAGQSGQLRTRVQAFVESLEMKQLRAAQKEDN